MKEKVVHIVDPSFDKSKACDLNDLHSPIVNKLQTALQSSLSAAYDGLESDWSKWSRNFIEPFLPGKQRLIIYIQLL
jgi:hypothetical protein